MAEVTKGLLSYTTSVPARRTALEVQELLAQVGARRILTDYGDDQVPSGISFSFPGPDGERVFRLPVRIEPVRTVLDRQHSQAAAAGKRIHERKPDDQKARDVAWRIALRWVEVQVALIRTELFAAAEVFLPFMVTKGGSTVYEAWQGQQLQLEAGGDPAGR